MFSAEQLEFIRSAVTHTYLHVEEGIVNARRRGEPIPDFVQQHQADAVEVLKLIDEYEHAQTFEDIEDPWTDTLSTNE